MPLGPGSIAFTGYNADRDASVAFVALEEIAAGTTIGFTAGGWGRDTQAFSPDAVSIDWTADTAVARGTVVVFTTLDGDPATGPTASTGSLSIPRNLAGASTVFELALGDLYAHLGPATAPSKFIAGISANIAPFTNFGDFSLFGTGLVLNETARWIDLSAIAAYVGPRTLTGNVAADAALINRGRDPVTFELLWVRQEASFTDFGESTDGTAPDLPFDATAFATSGGVPVAGDDAASAGSGAAVVIDVLANDSDPDDPAGAGLTITAIDGTTPDPATGEVAVADGTVAVAPDGRTLRFTSTAGFAGTATFAYTVADAEGLTSTGQVAVQVGSVTMLDFSDAPGGITADFDLDPATPDSAAPVITVGLEDFPGGRGVFVLPLGYSAPVSAFTPTPLLVDRVIGTAGGDQFASTVEGRVVLFEGGGGNDQFSRPTFGRFSQFAAARFDGGGGFDSYFATIGSGDTATGAPITLDLSATDGDGYSAVLYGAGGALGQDFIRDVESVGTSAGDDVVTGGGAGSAFFLGSGNDRFVGYANSEFVNSGEGNDVLDGGAGDTDIASWAGGELSPVVVLGLTLDLGTTDANGFASAVSRYQVDGGPVQTSTDQVRGFEEFWGSYGDDVILGGAADETLWDFQGSDTLEGRGGNDEVRLNNDGNDDTVRLGAGNDLLSRSFFGPDEGVDTLLLPGTRSAYQASLVTEAEFTQRGQARLLGGEFVRIAAGAPGTYAAEGTDLIESGIIERFLFLGGDGLQGTTDDQAFTQAELLAPPRGLIARNDRLTVIQGSSGEIDVLANDTSPAGPYPATYVSSASGAQHGTTLFLGPAGGPVTYRAAPGYVGQDQFTYQVRTASGESAQAVVTVDVVAPAPSGYQYFGGSATGGTYDFRLRSGPLLVRGSEGADTILGSTILPALGGTLNGGGGDDVIIGGVGNETIVGGTGADTVTGGAGRDTFTFARADLAHRAADDPFDVIADFQGAGDGYTATGDFLRLSGFSAAATLARVGDVAGAPDQHIYEVADGAFAAQFIIQYSGAGTDLVPGDYVIQP